MKEFEVLEDICEACGEHTDPSDLYTDLFNKAWQMRCPRCFYSIYSGDEKVYYNKLKPIVDGLLDQRKFNVVKSSFIVIANSFPYLRVDSSLLSLVDKKQCEELAIKAFNSKKIQNKFTLIRMDMKSNEKVLPSGSLTFVVSITAHVKFNSWLEYMEHEAYMHMRKELANMIIQ